MTSLLNGCKRQDYRYHTLNEPKYSDDEYNDRKDRLRKLDPKNKYFNSVGAPIAPGRKKIKFTQFSVGSLEKLRPKDAAEWVAEIKKKYKVDLFTIWPKWDGISLTLHYINGKLQAAYKRGEGDEGEDCLINAKHIQGVPLTLKKDKNWPTDGNIYIRGEAIIHKSIFNAKFSKFAKLTPGKYKTTRNFCGGMLNTFPDKKTKQLSDVVIDGLNSMTLISFGLWHYPTKKQKDYGHRSQELAALSAWGLTTTQNPSRWNEKSHKWFAKRDNVDWAKFIPVHKYDCVVRDWITPYDMKVITEEYFNEKLAQYNDLDIDQDGLVIEIPDNEIRKKIGFMPNGMTPKFMQSIKPERENQLTLVGRLAKIELEYSSRRIYTPVLVLKKPLNFNGVDVDHITGHNVGKLIEMGIDIGAKVSIIRSGKVIPHLMGLAKGQNKVANPSWLIKRCVYCNTKLQWTTDKKGKKINLFCPNKSCVGFGFETLDRFFSKVKIDGLARGMLKKMAEQGIDTVPKVLRVNTKQLSRVEGFGKKRAENLLIGIKNALKMASIATIAGASGIFANEKHGLGSDLLEPVVEKLGKVRLLTWTDEHEIRAKIIGIPNMGVERIKLFIEKLPEFQKFYAEIADLITADVTKLASTKLSGKTFVFTGWRSSELEAKIKANGGKVGSSVSAKTTAVLYGEVGHGKYNDAVKKNVKLIASDKSEEFIDKLMRG